MKNFPAMKVGGALAAALFGAALMSAPAQATPPSGFVPTLISNGAFGPLNVDAMAMFPRWGILVRSRSATDVRAFQLDVAPGGYSGWHTHPAVSFLTILSGTLVDYEGASFGCPAKTYHAGDTIIEEGGKHIHNLRNESGSPARLIAIGFFPKGAPTLISVNKPANCAS